MCSPIRQLGQERWEYILLDYVYISLQCMFVNANSVSVFMCVCVMQNCTDGHPAKREEVPSVTLLGLVETLH